MGHHGKRQISSNWYPFRYNRKTLTKFNYCICRLMFKIDENIIKFIIAYMIVDKMWLWYLNGFISNSNPNTKSLIFRNTGQLLFWQRPNCHWHMTELTQREPVFQITASPSARTRQIWRRTGNFSKTFLQFYVYDLRFKAAGLTTFLTEFWTLTEQLSLFKMNNIRMIYVDL